MRILHFAKRTAKEIVRDPLNLAFGIGFPVVLILLMTAIQANIPVEMFNIDNLTPGISVFALSFITLFSATLISKDRESAFLQRLYTMPMKAKDFILGYVLPFLPIAFLQCLLCYLLALLLGLEPTVGILWSLIGILPAALFFTSLGLLCGSVLGSKQVGGICGALLTNVAGWLSGTWFDLELVGGTFKKIAELLPFYHAVEAEKALLAGNFAGVFPHFWWVLGYALAVTVGAVACFLSQMRRK